jgi:hypothetical protein
MPDATIRIKATREDIERYQRLLCVDWSRETLDDVLSLLWKLIAGSVDPKAFAWQRVLVFGTGRKSAKDFEPQLIARIRDISLLFTEPALPAMPDHFTANRPSRTAAQAEQAWTYLCLQALARLEGDTGLFQDTQSLLFLAAAHFLLPQLQQQGLSAEHDCLACAMYVHTLLVWRGQPAHLLHLQSVLMDHLGDTTRRLELLDMSFLLTAPEDHAYLTKATTYWSELMDLGRYEEARNFLLRLARHAPDTCQEEIADMMSETGIEAANATTR